MWKTLLAILLVVLFSNIPTAISDTQSAFVVATCGAQSLSTGQAYPLTQDTTGKLCSNGGGSAPSGPTYTAGSYFYNVAGSTLTRPADTTAYAANETVCLSKSTTCTPVTISIASTNTGKGLINRLTLLKSGSSTTNATFIVWLFSAAPGLTTPTQEDATAYAGPRAADMPNYIGNATCSTPTATSDTTAQVWYECALSNPNTGGALVFQALSGVTTVDALVSVTAAYTPASSETFSIAVSGIY
jgi:hypothetical protein